MERQGPPSVPGEGEARARPHGAVRLGGARLDPDRGVIHAANGVASTLRPKTLALLLVLLERAGTVLSREEILEAVWPGVFVTDDSITQCVTELRRALGPDAGFLHTLPKRGYVLEVAPEAAPSATVPAAPDLGPSVPVVAVLPLRVLPPDPRLKLTAEGMLEGIVGSLTGMREPVVISANSTRPLAAEGLTLDRIGARLNAGYVASGSLRLAGGGLRLTMELAEAASGAVLWQRVFDLPDAPPIELEDRIAATIAHTLVPRLREAELRRAVRQAPGDLTAYHALLRAQMLMRQLQREPFELAGELLQQAIARDPGFATTHATLADWYNLRLNQEWSSDAAADIAAMAEAADRALALDGNHARALALRGHHETIQRGQHESALPLLERALEAAPNDSTVLTFGAPTHGFLGRPEETIRRAERAIALSPEDPFLFRTVHFLSLGHYLAGNAEQAAELGLQSRAANPRFTNNLCVTAAALAALGRRAEARSVANEILAIKPRFSAFRLKERLPLRDPVLRDRYVRQLVDAGLPAQ